MANITSILKNCTEITTAVDATLSNNNKTCSITASPRDTKVLFTKKVTASTNFVFNQEPTVSFLDTSHPDNYSFTVVDTGSLANNNLTAREFTIKYLFPFESSTGDSIVFNSKADPVIATSTGKIYSYSIEDSNIPSYGDKRILTVNGDANATLTVRARINGGADLTMTTAIVKSNVSSSATIPIKTVNPDIYVGMTVSGAGISGTPTVVSITNNTMVLSAAQTVNANTVLSFSGSFTAKIGSNGLFQIGIGFPSTTSDVVYDIILTEIASNSFVSPLTSPKTIAINQYAATTITFGITNNNPPASGSFTLSQNSFTNTGEANRDNSLTTETGQTRILFTASTSAAGYSIVLGSQEFESARWSSPTAVQGKYIQLNGGTVIAMEDFSIVIDNSQSTKVATISCLATILFHGSSDQTTNLNINDIITTQQ